MRRLLAASTLSVVLLSNAAFARAPRQQPTAKASKMSMSQLTGKVRAGAIASATGLALLSGCANMPTASTGAHPNIFQNAEGVAAQVRANAERAVTNDAANVDSALQSFDQRVTKAMKPEPFDVNIKGQNGRVEFAADAKGDSVVDFVNPGGILADNATGAGLIALAYAAPSVGTIGAAVNDLRATEMNLTIGGKQLIHQIPDPAPTPEVTQFTEKVAMPVSFAAQTNIKAVDVTVTAELVVPNAAVPAAPGPLDGVHGHVIEFQLVEGGPKYIIGAKTNQPITWAQIVNAAKVTQQQVSVANAPVTSGVKDITSAVKVTPEQSLTTLEGSIVPKGMKF